MTLVYHRHAGRHASVAVLCSLLSCSLSAQAECSKAAVCSHPLPVRRMRQPSTPTSTGSSGVLVTGIALTAVGVASLVAGVALTLDRGTCESLEVVQDHLQDCPMSSLEPAAWIAGGIMIGVGVPLIVVGARSRATRALMPAATVSTWANLKGAGVGLRFSL